MRSIGFARGFISIQEQRGDIPPSDLHDYLRGRTRHSNRESRIGILSFLLCPRTTQTNPLCFGASTGREKEEAQDPLKATR